MDYARTREPDEVASSRNAAPDPAAGPCGLAETEEESCTGSVEVALIATPFSTGAIDQELATVNASTLADEETAGACGRP